MDQFKMRKQVINAYPYSETWPQKVTDMGEKQLYAIWCNLRSRGLIPDEPKKFEPFYQG